MAVVDVAVAQQLPQLQLRRVRLKQASLQLQLRHKVADAAVSLRLHLP
jgi:hypothetical protein